MKNISVITVTQYKKFPSLKILKDILEAQTYCDRIYEWIIVEGSKDEEDGKKNFNNISKLKKETKLNIFYSKWRPNMLLGKLRNLSNELVSPTSEYIFCFDDDDYYFPERIEYTIEQFKLNPEKNIAGCKSLFIYDWHLKKSFLTNENDTFSSNNCLAYKKKYIKNHKYADNVYVGEEASFLEDFKNEDLLIQLDPKKIIYMNSHGLNTFNKREILFLGYFELHKFIKQNDAFEFPEPWFSRYKELYLIEDKSPYDIVFVCGFGGIDWLPDDTSLGGSEQAIIELCSRFALYGKKVAVYGNIKKANIFKNVDYFHMSQFNYNSEYNNIILWRDLGLMSISPFNVKAKRIILDLHDNLNISMFKSIHKSLLNCVSIIAVKSEYHKKEYIKSLNCSEEQANNISKHIVVIQNGLNDAFFVNSLFPTNKIKNRFCYCSCYTRGLIQILLYIWPKIIEYDPTAELHVYYGRDFCNDETKKSLMEILGQSKNVMDHGRCGRLEIIEEKKKANFQLYITNSQLEIDCISIKEAVKLNCIPLLSNFGVFKERAGVHFDEDLTNKESYERVASSIIDIMKDENKQEKLRQQMIIQDTSSSWDNIALIWLNNIILN